MTQISTMPAVDLTLCICTMNRPNDLRTCLSSVVANGELPAQIIVSDDTQGEGPSDSAAVVAEFPGVAYQRGPQRGLGPNRNACLERARSNWVLFIDDDVELPLHFMAAAQDAMQRVDHRKMILSGYELKAGEKVTPHNIDFWGFMHVPVENQDYRSLVINATLFPRRLFDAVRFDEQLRYGCEEMDMAHHAVAKGYTIAFCDNLFVHHCPSPVNRDVYKKYADASRLYVTTKVYWHYECLPLKAAAYVVLAPLHMLGAALKRRRMESVRSSCQSILLASRYLLTYCKGRRQQLT